jgi:hypothetical protein
MLDRTLPLAVAARVRHHAFWQRAVHRFLGMQDRIGPADDLRGLVAVQPPSALVPRHDATFRVERDDRILGGGFEHVPEEHDCLLGRPKLSRSIARALTAAVCALVTLLNSHAECTRTLHNVDGRLDRPHRLAHMAIVGPSPPVRYPANGGSSRYLRKTTERRCVVLRKGRPPGALAGGARSRP